MSTERLHPKFPDEKFISASSTLFDDIDEVDSEANQVLAQLEDQCFIAGLLQIPIAEF